MEGGRSAWLKAVMAAKKPGMSLGDAMKAAKKTYKKGGAGSCGSTSGGTLMGQMGPMGGRRRGTRKVKGGAGHEGMPDISGMVGLGSNGMPELPPMGGRRRRGTRKGKGKMMGGSAYGFTGGPYTGSDLPDGMSRFPAMSDATYQGPSELKGGRRRRGGAFAPSTDGKPAELPYAKPSVAPDTAVGANGTFSQSGSEPAGFGGRRRRQTKKGGRHRRGHRGGNQTVGSAMVYGAASSEAAAAARQAAADRNGYI